MNYGQVLAIYIKRGDFHASLFCTWGVVLGNNLIKFVFGSTMTIIDFK
jgi:hypothetical protein